MIVPLQSALTDKGVVKENEISHMKPEGNVNRNYINVKYWWTFTASPNTGNSSSTGLVNDSRAKSIQIQSSPQPYNNPVKYSQDSSMGTTPGGALPLVGVWVY